MTINIPDEGDFGGGPDPSGMPTEGGKPVMPEIERATLCCDCLYCRSEIYQGLEKGAPFCWHQHPNGPPAPQPINAFARACKDSAKCDGPDWYARILAADAIRSERAHDAWQAQRRERDREVEGTVLDLSSRQIEDDNRELRQDRKRWRFGD